MSLIQSKTVKEMQLLKTSKTRQYLFNPLIAGALFLGACTFFLDGLAYTISVIFGFSLAVLAYLFTVWSVDIYAWTHYVVVDSQNLWDATHVKVVPAAHSGSKAILPLMRRSTSSGEEVSFSVQRRKYLWQPASSRFEPLRFPDRATLDSYMSSRGLGSEDLTKLTPVYGPNRFDIPLPTFLELYKQQAAAPFFVFQMFCVLLWCLDEYWQYSVLTLFLLLAFEGTVVNSRIRNMQQLRAMAERAPEEIQAVRGNAWRTVLTSELLPGDLIAVARKESGSNLIPVDALLLSGSAVVNEAMLTGESTPRVKEALGEAAVELSSPLNPTEHAAHILYGGTEILQTRQEGPSGHTVAAPSGSCLAYVLRTGFETSQGKLLRTIIFATEHVTANTRESFLFIAFLLVFAVAASGYVLSEGLKVPNVDYYKLVLHCILVVTSVVPPELPMELTLAVNNSLVALGKLGIFCTEPFRIPFAGKVGICCFDKTGTLTGQDVVFTGLATQPGALLSPEEMLLSKQLKPNSLRATVKMARLILRHCTAVIEFEGRLRGDPMEVASYIALRKPNRAPKHRVVQRYHFNSTVKRMSVLYQGPNTSYVLTKGAPEVLQPLMTGAPPDFDATYQELARSGARVIALAWRPFNQPLSNQHLKNLKRENVERDLQFAGFAVYNCPAKPDSKEAVESLLHSNHEVMMITGDNLLTAVKVAQELSILDKPPLLMEKKDDKVVWTPLGSEPLDNPDLGKILNDYNLCVTGSAFPDLMSGPLVRRLAEVRVFARVSPAQKEAVLRTLKAQGHWTLMCGDGTNDVGALKQAHVGVALLNRAPAQARQRAPPLGRKPTMQELMKQLEAEEGSQVARLGDASIASAFTSRGRSVLAAAYVIRQGRCTLVTTHQMFKILALNCLVSAYSLSVLYLDGIKWNDNQATVISLLIAACFLFISRSMPLEQLSAQRPDNSIFTPYMFLSITSQFAVHLYSLISVVRLAKAADPTWKPPFDLHAEFAPSLLNSAVLILSCTMQASTFLINYQGHPFMQNLRENKPLRNCLLCIGGLVAALVCPSRHLQVYNLSPMFNQNFGMVSWPSIEFRDEIVRLMLIDLAGAFACDRVAQFLFRQPTFHGASKQPLKRRG